MNRTVCEYGSNPLLGNESFRLEIQLPSHKTEKSQKKVPIQPENHFKIIYQYLQAY